MNDSDIDFFDFLLKKIQTFNSNKVSVFHSTYEKAFPTKSLYIWEETNILNCDGFLYYGPQFAIYFNANGLEVGLTCYSSVNSYKNSWVANQRLYKESQTYGAFNIVNPVGFDNNYEIYNLNGIDYILYKMQHPNYELGEYVMTTPDNIDNYYEVLVSHTEIILKHIKTVIDNNKELSLGYPSLRFPDILKNSQGYYWRYLHLWELSPDGVYKKLIGDVEKCLETFPRQGQVSKFDILAEAEHRWKNVLNI